MLVKVRVNHQRDAYFIVDTGAAPMVVSPRLVKAMALRTEPNPNFTGNDYATSSKNIKLVTYINCLSGGGLELSDRWGMVSDVADEVAGSKSKTIDGIIGGSQLNDFAVQFDFENKQMSLIPGGNLSGKELAEMGFSGGKASGIVLKSGAFGSRFIFSVPAHIVSEGHGLTLPLMIDTGTPYTMVFDANNKLKIPTKQRSAPHTLYEMNSEVKHYLVAVSSLQVGSQQAAPNSTALTPFQCSVTYDTRNGKSLLGMDYLSHFRVIIDYPVKRLYLAPITNEKQDTKSSVK